jgi:Zn finger protein HypA/HybF involved in hydrogenase expression
MKATPVFKEDVDKALDEKLQKMVNQKLAEKEENDKKKTVEDKIAAIKKTLIPRDSHVDANTHVHEHTDLANDCPTCKGHTLKVEGIVAKCNGPNCGKEYLLLEKIKKINSKSERKDLLCTTCGHTMAEHEIKGKNFDACPLCGLGKGVMKINWDEIDSAKMVSKGLIR